MRYRIGSMMMLTFDDHVEDGSAPIRCVVVGRVAKVTKEYVCIDSWYMDDPDTPYDSNTKRFTILRKVVIKAKRLEVVA